MGGDLDMMNPYSGAIEIWQVPSAVGAVRNNTPDLMERVASPRLIGPVSLRIPARVKI
jgi:hypothetical protein